MLASPAHSTPAQVWKTAAEHAQVIVGQLAGASVQPIRQLEMAAQMFGRRK